MIQLIMYSFVIIYGDMTDNRSSKVIQIGVIYMDKRRQETAEFLSDCGCDIAQGFYYAKPMPLEDFNKKMQMA